MHVVGLLADAEITEDVVQQVVGVDLTKDALQFSEGCSEFHGDQFIALLLFCCSTGRFECLQSSPQAFTTPHR